MPTTEREDIELTAAKCWAAMDRSEFSQELADAISWEDLNRLASTNPRIAAIRDREIEGAADAVRHRPKTMLGAAALRHRSRPPTELSPVS